MKKYSSFDKQQLVTESSRRFVNEDRSSYEERHNRNTEIIEKYAPGILKNEFDNELEYAKVWKSEDIIPKIGSYIKSSLNDLFDKNESPSLDEVKAAIIYGMQEAEEEKQESFERYGDEEDLDEAVKIAKEDEGYRKASARYQQGERALEEKEDWMEKAFSKNKGGLHKKLGVPKGEDIPVSKMADALRAGGKEEKRARAAVNANPDKFGSIKNVGVEKKKKKKKKNEGHLRKKSGKKIVVEIKRKTKKRETP